MAHDHGDHGDHDHGTLTYEGTEVDEETMKELLAIHPLLAANLALTRRYAELTEEEKQKLPGLQRQVETYPLWLPGFHAPGDRCATCGKETTPLFVDRYAQGTLPQGAFHAGLPVHPTEACLSGFAKAHPNPAPRAMDIARRKLVKDLDRPTPTMSQFFRHDVLSHPPFGLEDWANSVSEANPKGLDRQTMRDIERLMAWVHKRLFHGH